MELNLKKMVLKAIIISSVFLLSSPIIYSQIISEKQKTMYTKIKFGEEVELKMNEKVYFVDSLSIVLTSFSHKRPYLGGPTKATSYLTISKDLLSEEIMLSVHGIEGKSVYEDGPSESERFDSLIWNQYEIHLKSFNYDKSIKIIVFKKN